MEKEIKTEGGNEIFFTDLNQLPLSGCILDSDGFVIESSKKFRSFTGLSSLKKIEEIILEKKDFNDFLEGLKRGEIEKSGRFTLTKGGQKPLPVKIVGDFRKSRERWILFVFSIIEERDEVIQAKNRLKEKKEELKKKTKQMEDSRSALLNILEDVDKSYKDAERERKKTFKIIHNLIDGMVFFNEKNLLELINPKAEEFFDIKGRDIIGRSLKDLKSFPTLKPLIEIITDKQGALRVLFREELKINNDFFLEITTIKIDDKEGVGVLVHIHDITREKRIERIKSEFVSVAAHQLRTPLSGIKWTLGTFLEEIEDGDLRLDEDREDLIMKAYKANERMVTLVNDLLNVSRIEEGRYIYDPEVVNLYEVLKPIIEDYEEIISKNENLELKINKVNSSLPDVEIDPEKIEIVVQNFLDNAIKYTDEGEITLSVSVVKGKKIRVSVQDDGVGVPEEQQERLFDKFFRAENVVRKDTEGSGLGLFISKNIIEAHNGEIGFHSTSGEGSVFYFTLPFAKSDN